MPTHPIPTSILYLTSALLDAVDGHAARYWNQSTRVGAVLDMLTDRISTVCLMVTLSIFYPSFAFCFQFLIALDIVSHWAHMYASLISGCSSHKTIDLNKNKYLYYYYTKPVLFLFCAGNELFFVALYLTYFSQGPSIAAPLKIGLWKLCAGISFPIMILKQIVSGIQLWAAFLNISVVDNNDRKIAALKSQKKK
eukprot:Sdes_comp20537_c0_seq4m15222